MNTLWQIIKYFLILLLTLGIIVSVGLLSFSGLFLPHLIPQILTFFLSGVVEGEVYRQQITKGFKEFKFMGKAGLRQLIIQALDNEEKNKEQKSAFFDEYYQLKEYIAGFKNKKLSKEQQKEKKDAERRLRAMEKYFVACVLSRDDNSNAFDQSINIVAEKIRKELPGIKRKINLLRASWILNILAGVGSAFAAKTSAAAVLIKFGIVLSVTASSALIWPLVIIAAMGYTWVIYHTICDIVRNEKLKEWWGKLKFWCRKEYLNDHRLRVIAVSLLTGLAIGLGVFATIATCGSWWFVVKACVRSVPYLTKAAKAIRDILIFAVGITQLLFNTTNSLKTVKTIIEKAKLPKPIAYLNKEWKKLRSKENWLQILNPFRIVVKIISIPYKTVVFIGHLIAMGATTDKLGKINPIITDTACGVSEGFQDAPFIFPDQQASKKNKEHEHEHGGILKKILNFVLLPFLCLSSFWNYLASQLNEKNTEGRDVLTLASAFVPVKNACKQIIGLKTRENYEGPKAPIPSKEWLNQEITMRFDKEEKRLDNVIIGHNLAQEKKTVIKQLKEYALQNLNSNNNEAENRRAETSVKEFLEAKNDKGVSRIELLEKNRSSFFFENSDTETNKFAEKVEERYFVLRPR